MATRNFNVKNGLTAGNITLDASTNTTTTSNLVATGNVSFTGSNVSLGSVSNVKITGGTGGYVLSTDGSGNLSWIATTATLAGAYVFTQSTPATTWVVNHNLGVQYVNVQVIDANGVSYTGRYNYPTITFNNAAALTITFDSAVSGYAAVTSGGGQQNVGGSNTQIQFNDANVLGGSAAFTFNKTSNLVSMGGALSVTGNANVGNLGTARVIATGNISGTQLISNIATGTAPFVVTSTTQVANLNVATAGTAGSATTAGTVTTAAQPNITSVGTLSSLAVSGAVTASTLTSNVATGTAPLTVTSTTRVSNLNVAYANVADFMNVTAPGTGTGYIVFANTTSGNVAEWVSSGITSNLANNSITATTFVGALSGAATSAGTATTAGTVTTAAQPNITSVGTLTGLTANGNVTINQNAAEILTIAARQAPTTDMVNVTNAGQAVVTSGVSGIQLTYVGGAAAVEASAYRTDLTPGTTTGGTWNGFRMVAASNAASGVTMNAIKIDNITGGAGTENMIYAGTGWDNILNYNGTSVIYGNGKVNGAEVVGTVANATYATSAGTATSATSATSATTAGTVTTAAQPNITSVGTLTSLGVNGTVTAVNFTANTGVFAGSGANLTTLNASNISSGTLAQARLANSSLTVNGTAISLGGSGTITANTTQTLSNGSYITGDSFNGGTARTWAVDATTTNTANKVVARDANGSFSANIITATLSGSATTAGTVTTAAQPNITSVGTLTSLSVTGNVAAGNLTTTGVLSVTGTGVSSIAGNLDMTGNTIINLATPTNSTDAATKQYVDDVAQGLHTHDACQAATPDTLANISGGTVTYNNGTSGVGATLTTTGSYTTIDGVTLTNGMRILVKNEANTAHNGIYDRTSATVLTRSTDFDTSTEMAGGDFTFVQAGTLYDNTGWVMPDAVTTVGTSPVVWVQFSGAGTYTAGTGLTLTGSQFSITNTAVTAGTYGNGDRVATFTVNSQGQLTAASNVAIAANAANLTGTTLASGITTSSLTTVGTLGTLSVTGNANVGNIGAATAVLTTGNITTINSGLLQNGNSNVTITANGNVTLNAVGGARIIATSAGANVTGTLGVSGNANVNNLGTAQVLATANVTAPQFISNVATGTAPFVVTSTTRVTNLNADLLGGLTTDTAGSNNTIVARGGAGQVTANYFISSVATGTAPLTVTSTTKVANLNVEQVDGYHADITSTASNIVVRDANANIFGNNFTGRTFTSNVATGTAPFVVTSTTQVANLNVANAGYATSAGSATTATSATTAGTVTTAAQPNITSVGTLTGLTANGNVTINQNAAEILTIAARQPPTTDMLVITNTGQNVATAGVSGLHIEYIGGAGAIEASAIRSDMTPGTTSGSTWNAFRVAATTAAASGVIFNGVKFDNKSTGAGTSRAFYIGTGYDEILNYNGTVVINGNGTVNASQVTGTVSSATTAGTVTTAAQPNITSVGTLTSLAVTGNITAGNLSAGAGGTVSGNLLSVATGNITTINSGLMQNGNSNVTITANGNVTLNAVGGARITATSTGANVTGTLGVSGNTTVGNLIGPVANGNSNLNIPVANGNVNITAVGNATLVITGTGANITGTLNATGNANVGNIGATGVVATTVGGTLTTAAQPNITSVGTLTSLGVSGTTGITSTDSSGAGATTKIIRSVNGTQDIGLIPRAASGAYNNLTVADDAMIVFSNSAAQGNANLTIAPWATGNTGIRIQSVSNTASIFLNATTTNVSGALNIAGTSNLGPVGNVTITGGSNGQVLTTNGSGVLSWSTVAGGGGASISNGTSNVNIATSGGNITMSVGGTANVVTVTSSNVQLGTGSGGNISGANVVTANMFISSVATGVSASGTVQSNATALTSQITVVSTVNSGTGVRLPTAIAGMRFTIVNTSANALLVYPASTGIINSQAANAAYSQPAGARLDYISTTTTQWYTLNATYG